jgi:hypothetical protein
VVTEAGGGGDECTAGFTIMVRAAMRTEPRALGEPRHTPTGRGAIRLLAGIVVACVVASLVVYASRSSHERATANDQCASVTAFDSHLAIIGTLPVPITLDSGALQVREFSRGAVPAVPRLAALMDFESTAEVAGVHSCVGFGLARVTIAARMGLTPRVNRLTWVGIAHSESAGCRGGLSNVAVPIDVVLVDAERVGVVDVYATGGVSCDGTAYQPTLTAARQVVSVPFTTTIKGEAYYVTYVEPTCTGRETVQRDGPLTHAVTEIDIQIPFNSCLNANQPIPALPRPATAHLHAPTGPKVVLQT